MSTPRWFISPCASCLSSGPGSPACQTCYLYHYVLPNLAKELAKLELVLVPTLPQGPSPGPDPLPFHFGKELIQLEGELIRAFAGDPDPQPNIFSRDLRLKATVAFREALAGTITTLDKQIDVLQKC